MKKIHLFDKEFCKNIIDSLPSMKRFILQYDDEKINEQTDVEIQRNQPTDADGWYPSIDAPNIKHIVSILKNNIQNVETIDIVIQRLDSNKKSRPHIDYYDYTCIILLNNDFIGGDLIVEDKKSNLKIGDFFIFQSNNTHYVEKIDSGERYTLVIFVKVQQKNTKSLL